MSCQARPAPRAVARHQGSRRLACCPRVAAAWACTRRSRGHPRARGASTPAGNGQYSAQGAGMLAVRRGQVERPPQRQARATSGWAARYTFADICGPSPALAQARDLAQRAAHAECAVLLLGESGTGKELFAHAIHQASPRQAGPLVPIDCAAIPRDLLEAELFGYAPGAFSGAAQAGKPGKFELAHGGTVFLDEIGEMPLEMQAKLLRVLQEHQVVRVGGLAPVPVDFTVIAATNRPLETMASQGAFRQD